MTSWKALLGGSWEEEIQEKARRLKFFEIDSPQVLSIGEAEKILHLFDGHSPPMISAEKEREMETGFESFMQELLQIVTSENEAMWNESKTELLQAIGDAFKIISEAGSDLVSTKKLAKVIPYQIILKYENFIKSGKGSISSLQSIKLAYYDSISSEIKKYVTTVLISLGQNKLTSEAKKRIENRIWQTLSTPTNRGIENIFQLHDFILRYIYQNKSENVSVWLENNSYPKLLEEIEKIENNLFPEKKES